MADDSAPVRIPQITDMPAGEAYAFLGEQMRRFGSYKYRAGAARARGDDAMEAKMSERARLLHVQVMQDVYRLTIGAPVWDTQP